jgi:hypothetical protein
MRKTVNEDTIFRAVTVFEQGSSDDDGNAGPEVKVARNPGTPRFVVLGCGMPVIRQGTPFRNVDC